MQKIFVALLALVCATTQAYVPGIELLRHSMDFVLNNAAPDYHALMPYYVGQQTSSDCSAASLAMILSAATRRPIAEAEIIQSIDDPEWTANVAPGGSGTNLTRLASLMARGLKAYGLPGDIDMVRVEDDSPSVLATVREMLVENEKSAGDLIVANFDQGVVTGGPSVGHFSPIAAYDAGRRRVLVLDVDREWVEPYWVPDSLLVYAMQKYDPVKQYHRGFLRARLGNRRQR